MNIDELTLGQIREIQNIGFIKNNDSKIYSRYTGMYVIVRSINEGINAGFVIVCDETGIVLEKVRRLHYHKPLDKKLSWYEGVAESGLGDGCRVSCEVAEKAIIEKYSILLCTEKASKSIQEHKTHEQS